MTNYSVVVVLLFSLDGHLVAGQSTSFSDGQRSEQKMYVTHRLDHVIRSMKKIDNKFDQQEQLIVELINSNVRQGQFITQLLDAVDRQRQSIEKLNQTLSDVLHQTRNVVGQCCAIPVVLYATQNIRQSKNGTVVVTYTCYVGYQFNSGQMESTSTCNDDSWTPIDSSCNLIHCPRLDIANAELSAYSTSYQSTVNLTCSPGYQLSDDVTSVVVTCQANGTWWLPTTTTTPVCEPKTLRPTLTYSIRVDQAVNALTSFNDQLFVTTEGTKRIDIYSTTTFQLTRSVTFSETVGRLFGLAPCPNDHNCIYVSDYAYSKVHKVKLPSAACSNTATTTSWSVASNPIGLSVNRLHNVLVASGSGMKIQEYTPSGTLVREISDSNRMWHAVEHVNDTLVVSRRSPVTGVCLMSADGQVLRSYGNTEGGGPGQMHDPREVAVDSEGYVLVADDNNNRILVLDPTLTDARPLPMSVNVRLTRPLGMWFDESGGRLYVGEYVNDGRVLVFDNVFNLRSAFTA